MIASKPPRPVREAALFLALTLGLSYLVFWGPLAFFKVTAISFVSGKTGPAWAIALYVMGGFVPSGVAVALISLRQGKRGLAELWRRMTRFRIGWPMYAAALAIVVVGTACQIALNALLGHAFDLSIFLVQLPSVLPLLVLGPLSEELGWRGYLLPKLMPLGKPKAYLLMGLIWGMWHWPLVLAGFMYPGNLFAGLIMFTTLTTVLGIYINELTLRQRSSILAGWAHGVFNTQRLGMWALLFPTFNPWLGGFSGLLGLAFWLLLGLWESRRARVSPAYLVAGQTKSS